MIRLRISDLVLETPTLIRLFKECTPKILVYADSSLDFDASNDFGLTQFVQTLENSTIHGMTPIVVKAHRSGGVGADLNGYTFDNATHGLTKSRYDMVFLFGIRSTSYLQTTELDAIKTFMQAGGGVFATGDHEELGAGLSADIPRVRNMRKWTSGTPDIRDDTRLSTNLSGDDGNYTFSDQSDAHPQRVFLNRRTEAGGVGVPHPLMQSPNGDIEHIPDHPHEGECVLPTSLSTTFPLAGVEEQEWPEEAGTGVRVAPEMVALSVSHGGGFGTKAPLEPRSFIAIAAWDGHRVDRGRVVTDATWHHFVNTNIDGTESSRNGLYVGGNPTPELIRLRDHWTNLATWLMPETTRRCLRYPFLITELVRFPLVETLRIPPLEEATPDELREIGQEVRTALASRGREFVAQEFLQDTLQDGLGSKVAARKLAVTRTELGLADDDLATVALGGAVAALASRLKNGAERSDKARADLERAFDAGAKVGAKRAVTQMRAAAEALTKELAPHCD